MRQYCSGGSRIWSSIHPLPGRLQQGWFRKNAKRPPGRSTRATSSMASSTASMCSNTRQATTASKARVGERQGVGARAGVRPVRPPRRAASLDLVRGRVDADHRVGPSAEASPGRPAPRRCRRRAPGRSPAVQVHRDGEDLLGVLRVGAVGELALPPVGVGLPQVGVRRGGRGAKVAARTVAPRRRSRTTDEWSCGRTASTSATRRPIPYGHMVGGGCEFRAGPGSPALGHESGPRERNPLVAEDVCWSARRSCSRPSRSSPKPGSFSPLPARSSSARCPTTPSTTFEIGQRAAAGRGSRSTASTPPAGTTRSGSGSSRWSI